MAPVLGSCLPLFAKPFLIDISVLTDDPENPGRFRLCEPKADRGSIVKHIKKELLKPHLIGKLPDDISEMIKRISERGSWRHVRPAKPRIVGSDQMKLIFKRRDQIAEHVTGGRETVKKEESRFLGAPRFAIKNIKPLNLY